MSQPYEPRFAAGPGCPAWVIDEIQQDINVYYRGECITQEIVMEPLASGGHGYKLAIYKNGVRLPDGLQGI